MKKIWLRVARLFLSVWCGVSLAFLYNLNFVSQEKLMVFGVEQIHNAGNDEVYVLSPGVVEIKKDIKTTIGGEDGRLILIENYLRKFKSPLLPYSRLILSLSDEYGVDYRLVVAIGQQESNLCKKIPENSYNCWGYGIHSKGTLRFESYEEALRSYVKYLREKYFDKGYDTVEKIMSKYCPHSNGSWAYGVNQFMAEIESGKY